jgi:hypothetical protein
MEVDPIVCVGRLTIPRGVCAVLTLVLVLPAAGCGTPRPYWATSPIIYDSELPAPSEASTIPLSADVTSAVRALVAMQRGAAQLGNREFYVRPATRPAGSVFDSLRPTGRWSAGWRNGGDRTLLAMYIAPGADGKTWGWGSYPGIQPSDDEALSRALRGRHASARFVWASNRLCWWVVRFDDGTEAALPVQVFYRIWVDGVPLQDKLYPADIIFREARI